MKTTTWRVGLAAVLSLMAAKARANIVVSTIPAWDGISSVSPWGPTSSGASGTYGQTFLDPAGNPVLQSMTFEISDQFFSIPFRAYVYQWDMANKGLTGPALFTSAPMTVNAAAGFQAVTVNTGGVTLTPGSEYVAFFSTIGEGGAGNASASWGLVSSNPYTDGTFVFNNSQTLSGLSVPANPAWNTIGGGPPGDFGDLAFSLSFTGSTAAVPEPATLAPAVLAALAGAGLAWRKRRRTAA
jgi:hypothetical protein